MKKLTKTHRINSYHLIYRAESGSSSCHVMPNPNIRGEKYGSRY